MASIAIIGAAGRVGEAAAQAFLNAGWTVRGIARGTKLTTLLPGVERIEADVTDRKALIEACRGADVILHAVNPAYDKWETTVLPFAENALAAAVETGATLMLPGNVYNFGTTIHPDMGEDAPQNGDTGKGAIRVAMEHMFEAAAGRGEAKIIILRGGDYYGGKRPETWLDLMIAKDLKKGKFIWPGPDTILHCFAYLPDFAQTLVEVAQKRETLPAFARFHFSGHAVTGTQMRKVAERIVGKPLSQGSVPWGLLRLIGLVSPVLREVVKMRYLWDAPHSLANDKLRALIGAEPHTDLDTALEQALKDLDLI